MATVGVVGAGPVGLFVANVLVRAGIDCEVFERLSEDAVRARARAGLIEDRTVRLLDAEGLADRLLDSAKVLGTCEFRRHDRRYVFNYGDLSGAAHRVYPQQQLVGDLIDTLEAAGGGVRFAEPVEAIRVGERPTIVAADGSSIGCDIVVGCDGFHGVSRAAAAGCVCSGIDFGAQWLSLLAEAPPSSEHQIYGLHPEGFAGHLHRTDQITRFYLQVPNGTCLDDWTDDRIWSTLQHRLAADGETLTCGPLVECSLMELRSYVTAPMQSGSLYLAGDAAHIVTPAGGKGMNLALQDAADLVEAIRLYVDRADRRLLDGYTTRRLPQVWRAVEFSYSMAQLLLAHGIDSDRHAFHEGLRDRTLAHLLEHGDFARDFARTYVGVDS